jgi:hypothetical protein
MQQIPLVRAHLLLALAALVVGSARGHAQTWIQWSSDKGGNNHYYALTTVATNWDEAEKLAESWGGTLATITSSNEQQFINDTFLNGALEHRPVWIGLASPPQKRPFRMKMGQVEVRVGGTRDNRKEDYHWVTGEAVTYENWHANQPDNAPPGENYVAINWFYSDSPPRGIKGDWNDAPPDGTTRYGGATSGPYFGIVERDYDPKLPVRARPIVSKNTFHLILLAAAVVIFFLLFIRARRRKKSPT